MSAEVWQVFKCFIVSWCFQLCKRIFRQPLGCTKDSSNTRVRAKRHLLTVDRRRLISHSWWWLCIAGRRWRLTANYIPLVFLRRNVNEVCAASIPKPWDTTYSLNSDASCPRVTSEYARAVATVEFSGRRSFHRLMAKDMLLGCHM